VAVSSRSLAPLKVLSQRYPGKVLVVAGDLTNSQTVLRMVRGNPPIKDLP
jgi:hypothetical protein